MTSMEENVKKNKATATIAVNTAVGVSSTLSITYVIWFLRGGSLLASMAGSLPAWRMFDPLPVLDSWEGAGGAADPTKDDEDEGEKKLKAMMK